MASRRFSLDKIAVDPALLNRILSADGDETLGSWDGESIHDLIKELERIEEIADANYSALPHKSNLPEDMRYQVAVDFPIWACDKSGLCLVGETAAEVKHLDDVRAHYQKKFGGLEKFQEKLRREIGQRNENLKLKIK